DFILSNLCERLLNRNLFKIKLSNKPFGPDEITQKKLKIKKRYNINEFEASFFTFSGRITNLAYSETNQTIKLLTQKGKVVNLAQLSDQINSKALSNLVTKYYLCYPKKKD